MLNLFQRLNEPWLVTESLHLAIEQTIEVMIQNPDNFQAYEEKETKGGNVQKEGEIGIVSLRGTMMRNPSALEKLLFDTSDTDEFRRGVEDLAEDDSIDSILLDIDSGGGSIAGVPEASNAVKEASKKKPVVAYSAGMIGSAAYWIASQADSIVGSPSARFGSIGVYLPFLDASEAFKQDGLKMEVITNKEGKYKGAGFHGTSLTGEQRDQLQAEVQEIFGLFKSAVGEKREGIKPEAMQGQTFLTQSAKKSGLIDFEGSKEDALTLLLAEAKRRKS